MKIRKYIIYLWVLFGEILSKIIFDYKDGFEMICENVGF